MNKLQKLVLRDKILDYVGRIIAFILLLLMVIFYVMFFVIFPLQISWLFIFPLSILVFWAWLHDWYDKLKN